MEQFKKIIKTDNHEKKIPVQQVFVAEHLFGIHAENTIMRNEYSEKDLHSFNFRLNESGLLAWEYL